jgi:hypothetical protein
MKWTDKINALKEEAKPIIAEMLAIHKPDPTNPQWNEKESAVETYWRKLEPMFAKHFGGKEFDSQVKDEAKKLKTTLKKVEAMEKKFKKRGGVKI